MPYRLYNDETVKRVNVKQKQGNGRNEADDSLFFYLKIVKGIFHNIF